MDKLEAAIQALTVVQTLTTIILAAVGGIALWRKAPFERKTLNADAEVDLADADHKRIETDQKRYDLYEQMFNKLLERDQIIAELRGKVLTLEGTVTSLQSQLATTSGQLDSERTLRIAAERERDAQRLELTRKVIDLENQLHVLQATKG